MINARLDDLVSDRALVFPGPGEFVGATTVEQVRPLLRQVDAATRGGRWAIGWVSYDATPAFLPELAGFAAADGSLPPAGFWLTDAPQVTTAMQGLPTGGTSTDNWSVDWSAPVHAAKVRSVQTAIAAGETYQANLTTRLSGTLRGDPDAWYAELGRAQRGAFHALLRLDDRAIVSASPERFFRWSGDRLLCSPMKGTAARGADAAADAAARTRLLASAKERAENIMITDLVRNDLGRLARTGTVRVSDLLRAERYPTVWQLVSDVEAELPAGTDLLAIFDTLFPCGSITGAPKISSTALLAELEHGPRGLYCGAIGYVAPPQAPVRAEFAVAIRTAVVDLVEQTISYGVGSGITIDSDPEQEYAELAAKAKVVTEPAPQFGLPAPQFGLIETFGLRTVDGRQELINGERHLQRLAHSAEHFGFVLDLDLLRRQVRQATAGLTGARVRIELAADDRARVSTAELPQPTTRPLRVSVAADLPVDPDSPWVRHKTTVREHYDAARRAFPDADEVIMVNTRGQLTEATTANLLLRFGDRWYTPPSDDGCLPGVARQVMIDSGRLSERSLTVDDLRRADEVALINSLRGWRRVGAID